MDSRPLTPTHARPQPEGTPERLSDATPAEFVHHILQRYHEPLKRDVPKLVQMAERVEKAHADHPRCPRGLTEHLRAANEELFGHLAKEEQMLFPFIVQGALGPMIAGPVRRMQMEHEDHTAMLETTRTLTGDLEVPPEACETWHALYAALRDLERDLLEHIQLENEVLFPKALGTEQ